MVLNLVWVLAGLSLLFSLLYGLCWTRKQPSGTRTLIKSVPIACLALIAWFAGAPWLLTAGLFLGATGDAFLSLDGENSFLAGLGAFLLGHAAFALLFYGAGGGLAAIFAWPWPLASALLLGGFAGGMLSLLNPRLGQLRPAVWIYVLAIFAMGLSALALPLQHFAIAVTGAFMFILSDAILASELFLMREASKLRAVSSRVLWFLYWGGQAAIAWPFVCEAMH